MAQPYVGEIRMFGGNFAPAGWMLCDGQLLPISENETLFQLIGTTYGGDGESTFALPNLQSRIPIHMGQGAGLTNRTLAEAAGVESVTLTTQQIPIHTHAVLASQTKGTDNLPSNNVMASQAPVTVFKPSAVAPGLAMNAASVTPAGGNQPHDNMHPFLCINFIISLYGLFPQPT